MAKSNPKYITFPHQVNAWPAVKVALQGILAAPPFSGKDLVDKLKPTLLILHPDLNRNILTVFNGLKNYLKEAHWQKREVYFSKCFPTIVQYALDIEENAPQSGLKIAVQNEESKTVIPRKLAASIVACSFLCLWPGRKYDRRSLLNGINFFEFFPTCASDPGQAGKLECILHYFEVLAEEGEPVGNLTFHRQILPKSETFTLKQWEHSESKLCACQVFTTGRIEDAGPKVLQVDFANRKIGGGVLSKGKVQEEIRFAICPELISGQLFMEAMTELEAIVMQGFQNYSDYTGYRGDLRFTGPFPDTAQRDCHGNLENYMCAIDALSFKGRLVQEEQYHPQHLLRELNKAFIGFKQDFLEGSADPLHGEYTPTEIKEETQMRGIVETYFFSLSETILTKALQESLVCLKDETSSPSPATSHSSGQNGRTHPETSDLVGTSLDYARRRSSNLSDSSSRRSSSTTGSRRSSGNLPTSSECSELEEYYQAYQARHSLKPSVIKEEIGDSSETTSDVHQLADQVMQSIFQPAVLSLDTTTPEVKAFSREQPKEAVVRPKARVLSHPKSVHSTGQIGRQKSPGRQCKTKSSSKEFPTSKQQQKSVPLQKPDKDLCFGSSVDSVEETGASSLGSPSTEGAAANSTKKEIKVEFKSSQLAFRPPQGKSSSASKSNESLIKSSSSSSDFLADGENLVVRDRRREPPAIPDNLYSYAGYLSDCVMDHAWREVYEIFVGERYRSDSYSSSKHSEKGRVEGFIGGIVENVWNYSAYNVRKHYKTKQEQQQMWTSDSDIDMDLDLYIYADDFVQDVITEAVGLYKSQKQEELRKVEAMWRKAQEKFELDAKYFNAEFSRYWKEVPTRRRGSGRLYTQSRIRMEMQRRRSLDETGRGYRRNASGFHDATLENFEQQLLKSAGEEKLLRQSMTSFERELLNVNSNTLGSHFLPFPAARRASEPVTTRRASYDVGHLCPSERRRGSSAGSTSSREMILDWLNQSQRSSSSSANGRQSGRHRTRTTSSHLDWYAQDLLLEAFNDALTQIFGDVHSAMGVSAGVSGTGDIDSINNSFSSSQSTDQICDTYIAIPMSAQSLSSTSQQSARPKQFGTRTKDSDVSVTDGTKDDCDKRTFTHEAIQSSSSPVNTLHYGHCGFGNESLPGKDMLSSQTDSERSNNKRTRQSSNRSNIAAFELEHGSTVRSNLSVQMTSESDFNTSDAASQHSKRTKVTADPTFNPSTASTHERQSLDMFHRLVDGNSGDFATLDSQVIPSGRSMRSDGILDNRNTHSNRSTRGRSHLVENLAEHMMEGMCENLSNEVLEGAVHTLNTQPREERAHTVYQSHVLPVATGNWGCGAYRGDPQLKALIQWVAASQRGVPNFLYYTFQDRNVAKLESTVQLIQEKHLCVGELMKLITRFCDLKDNQKKPLTLFDFIQKSL